MQVQNGKICFWLPVDEVSYKVPVTFYIAGTGREYPSADYIGTVQLDEYVWHIFKH